MSRQDPGAASGGIPTEPGRCTCTHLEPIHTITAKGRGSCSASICNCRRYAARTEETP